MKLACAGEIQIGGMPAARASFFSSPRKASSGFVCSVRYRKCSRVTGSDLADMVFFFFLGGGGKIVNFRGKNEIALRKAVDLVGPYFDTDFSPGEMKVRGDALPSRRERQPGS